MASVLQRKYEIRICQLTSNINMNIRTCIVQFLRLSPILQSTSYAIRLSTANLHFQYFPHREACTCISFYFSVHSRSNVKVPSVSSIVCSANLCIRGSHSSSIVQCAIQTSLFLLLISSLHSLYYIAFYIHSSIM